MKNEVEVLNFDELDVEELEQRLDMAIAHGAVVDGWFCGCDTACVDCGTQCGAYCATACVADCTTLCGVDGCGTDCGVNCGTDGGCLPQATGSGASTNMLPVC